MTGALACRRCGASISADDMVCTSCGATVESGGSAARTAPGPHLGDGVELLLDKLREVTLGEYEVRGLLGTGGMATVFSAYDLLLNRKVALKVMHPGLLGSSRMRERFRQEARLAAALNHPNVVTIHAVKERGPLVFFDLKLVD